MTTTPAFHTMNEHKFDINTVPGSAPGTYASLKAGIKNVAIKNNEKLDQATYLDGNGFGSTDVIAAQMTLAFTSDRKIGDPAQDFIFSKAMSIGTARHTQFKWTLPDTSMFQGECTIANVEGPTGDAGSKGEFKFEIHFNGAPTYTAAP
jgi:hypothetical protein